MNQQTTHALEQIHLAKQLEAANKAITLALIELGKCTLSIYYRPVLDKVISAVNQIPTAS